MICSDPLTKYGGMLVLGSVFSFFITTIIYFIGSFFSNPRIKITAINTIFSIFASIFIGLIVSAVIVGACSIEVNVLADMFTGFGSLNPSSFFSVNLNTLASTPKNNIYNFSLYYLSWAKIVLYYELEAAKNELANAIRDGSVNQLSCRSGFLICLVGGAGESNSPSSGKNYMISIYNMKITSISIGLLTILAMMKFLAFIQVGFIDFIFPIAIIARSLPGLRSYGSALLTLFTVLYFLYPFLITMNAFVWFPVVDIYGLTYSSNPVYPLTSCVSSTSGFTIPSRNPFSGEQSFIKKTAMFFITGFFLPAIDIIILIVSVKYIGRLFEQEIFVGKVFDIV